MSFFGIISLLFTVVFSVTGPFVQFFPLFLSKSGLGASQIALAMSCLAVSKIISTMSVAFFIDRSPKPHFYLAFAAGFTGGIWFLIYLYMITGGVLVPLTLLFALTWSATVPLTEGFSVRACRLQPILDYGKMRLFGSASFVISGFLCGFLIDSFDYTVFPIYISVACMCVGLLALKMPNFFDMERKNNIPLPTTNIDVMKKLALNKDFLLIVFGSGIMHAGHTVLLQSGAVEWTKAGYNGGVISLFFSIGVIAEIVLFYFGTKLERKLTIVGFFMLAALASIVRWAGMTFNPDFLGILFLQSLHGLTFGALHLGCVRYFKENLPDGTLGAAQLIYGAVMWGVVMIPAALVGGYLYESYSLGAYWAMVMLVLLGLGIMLCAKNNSTLTVLNNHK